MSSGGPENTPAPGARLLVVKPKMIGDTLLAMPALQALRRARPDLVVDLVVRAGSEGVLPAGPAFGRVLLTVPPDDERRTGGVMAAWNFLRQLRSVRYAGACDLTGTERGHFLLLGARAGRKLAAPPAWDLHQRWLWRHVLRTAEVADWPLLHAVERDAAVLGLFTGTRLGELRLEFPTETAAPPATLPASYAIVQPGSRMPAKVWPEENWPEIIRLLVARCGHVVLSSGRDPAEVALCRRLAATAPRSTTVSAGAWSWSELAAAMRGARVFVGSDTAAAHLAAATQLPAVIIWGPSHEHIWAPWSDRAWLVIEDRIVPVARTRRIPPAANALARSTAANRPATVAAALEQALASAPV